MSNVVFFLYVTVSTKILKSVPSGFSTAWNLYYRCSGEEEMKFIGGGHHAPSWFLPIQWPTEIRFSLHAAEKEKKVIGRQQISFSCKSKFLTRANIQYIKGFSETQLRI